MNAFLKFDFKPALRILFISFCLLATVVFLMLFGPFLFGLKPYFITSSSMRPVLNKGDIVYIKKARPEQLKKDAIITYRQSETDVIVTHRISRIDSDKQLIYTIGDANFGEDYTPISYHDVIGIYSGYKVTIFELFY